MAKESEATAYGSTSDDQTVAPHAGYHSVETADSAVPGSSQPRRTGVAAAALTLFLLGLVVAGVMTGSKSTGLVVGETGELDSEATSHVAESKAVSAYSDFTEYVVGCAATGGFWTDHNLMLTP